MSLGEPVLRVATPDDASPVEALMKESTAALFPLFYDEAQTASAVEYVAHIDPMLLGDGTYYVIESGEEPIACGGWSRRQKLYTGSGDADFLLITETNEAESAIAALLATAAAGSISDVTTSRAWTGAEFKAVADKASKVASLYTPPGKK